jgi:Cu(I)/Ag(I) efflux system protein CusF
MKLVLATALLIAAPAFAQTQGPTDTSAQHPATSSDTTEATGQIRSVDTKAGTVTIHHSPIAALGWPAMTMTFKAAPEVLKTARAGQTVKFTLKTADNVVLAIQPQ